MVQRSTTADPCPPRGRTLARTLARTHQSPQGRPLAFVSLASLLPGSLPRSQVLELRQKEQRVAELEREYAAAVQTLEVYICILPPVPAPAPGPAPGPRYPPPPPRTPSHSLAPIPHPSRPVPVPIPVVCTGD